ncbi:MAG: CopG family transcriptional regulator [FCB group bacterium]|nr:CopG family transcriptional regulator [FCB group bacterium]
MSKTVTLRLKEDTYLKFQKLAKLDNRPLSNFIETAVLRYINESEYIDSFEGREIEQNDELNASIKRGLEDANSESGRFV